MEDNPIIDDLVDHLINGERVSGSYENVFYQLEKKKLTTFTMPQLVDALNAAPEGTSIWNPSERRNLYTTSIKFTGATQMGTKVVGYAHTDHYLSNSGRLANLKRKNRFDENAADLPSNRFQVLVEMDGAEDELGNRIVWVFDENRANVQGKMSFDAAAKNPRVIGALCGVERTEKFLERYEQHHSNQIFFHYKEPLGPWTVGQFIGLGYDGQIKDELNPITHEDVEFIGFEGRSRPNSWQIIRLADSCYPSPIGSDSIQEFGINLINLYIKVAKMGYSSLYNNADSELRRSGQSKSEIKKTIENKFGPMPSDPGLLYYKEARPSLNQVLSLTHLLDGDSREAENSLKKFLTRLPDLYD